MSDFPPNIAIRPLLIDDLDQVEALESVCFPELDRASREKLAYRLSVCPELCLGLFLREYDFRYNQLNLPEVATRLQVEQLDKPRNEYGDDDENELVLGKLAVLKETLIGHVLGTKIASNRITEDSMQVASPENANAGHINGSNYIGVHSVAVHPDWRGKSFATLLLHDYIQRMLNQEVAEEIVIIVHPELIPFYTHIGFSDLGESECQFGGSKWHDMSIHLIPDLY